MSQRGIEDKCQALCGGEVVGGLGSSCSHDVRRAKAATTLRGRWLQHGERQREGIEPQSRLHPAPGFLGISQAFHDAVIAS